MTADYNDGHAYNITYLVTMNFAYQMLSDGVVKVEEFKRFFDEMHQKYKCENVRRLYQSKLDIHLDQSVNGDTKGA